MRIPKLLLIFAFYKEFHKIFKVKDRAQFQTCTKILEAPFFQLWKVVARSGWWVTWDFIVSSHPFKSFFRFSDIDFEELLRLLGLDMDMTRTRTKAEQLFYLFLQISSVVWLETDSVMILFQLWTLETWILSFLQKILPLTKI